MWRRNSQNENPVPRQRPKLIRFLMSVVKMRLWMTGQLAFLG
jgi:hypothetical protein